MKPPVDDIVPRSFPEIRPENGTGMYLMSKMEEKKIKNFPEWDYARDSLGMSLFLAQRELYLSKKRLDKKRAKQIWKTEDFNVQWADLQKKEKVFKESFAKFNKFVRENQEKRDRAEKRILDEIVLQDKRQKDVDNIKSEIEYLTTIKFKMDQRIKEYRLFEDYLTGVIKSGQMFKNVNDIIVRYEALIDAKQLLSVAQEKQLAALESARTDMAKLIEDKSLVLIGLNNKVADLQGRYDSAKSNSLSMETLVSKIKDVSTQRLGEITFVKTSCYNMYRMMCKRQHVQAVLAPDDFEGHLLFIKKTMRELQRVYNSAKKLCDREVGSLLVEIPSLKK